MGSMSPIDGKPRHRSRHWRLYVFLGRDENGKKLQKSKRVRGTLTEAKKELVKFENECLGITSKDCPFADYAKNYLERHRPLWKYSTYQNRKAVVDTFIKIFGKSITLSQMRPHIIEKKMNALLVEGPSGNPCKPSYVASLYSHLSSIFNDAVKDGILTRNPVSQCKRPSGKTEERKAPSPDELRSLIAEMDPASKYEMSVLLQASLGIRRGESLALRWQDIDFENRVIHIRHNLQMNCALSSPKTEDGVRDLPMPPFLVAPLELRKAIVERDIRRSVKGGLLKKEPDFADVFVVCDEMGRPVGPGAQSSWWVNHRARFGMSEYTEHDIRHGYLTALAHLGIHPKVAQKLAGHSSPLLTLQIYQHADMEERIRAVDKYANIMAEIQEE